MNIEFDCPRCQRHLSSDSSLAGTDIVCPSCRTSVTVPSQSGTPGPPPVPGVFCPKCGQKNDPNNFKCTGCGFVLHAPAQPQYVAADDSGLGALIPTKNAQALWAYYLAIFSLIPCIGSPLGIAAFVLGMRALKFARLKPDAKGRAHAWVGIVLGGICGFVYTAGIIIAIAVALTHK